MPFTLKDIAIFSPVVIFPFIGMLVHNKQLRAKIFGKKTEVPTSQKPIDLEKQQHRSDAQLVRKPDSTFTDMHGKEHLPPPPAYQPPTSTHKLPEDCDISCCETQARGHHVEYLLGLAPPIKVLEHEGQDRKWVIA